MLEAILKCGSTDYNRLSSTFKLNRLVLVYLHHARMEAGRTIVRSNISASYTEPLPIGGKLLAAISHGSVTYRYDSETSSRTHLVNKSRRCHLRIQRTRV